VSPAYNSVFSVRVNGKLAEQLGTSRLSIEVSEPATIQDIIDEIKSRYPDSISTILEAIPFSAGTHKSVEEIVKPGQEITLLMPAAGG